MRQAVGHPTILINNAGIGHGSTILASSEQQVRSVFAVNTFSHYWMVQEFLPRMIELNHGHVVTIASSLLIPGCAEIHISNRRVQWEPSSSTRPMSITPPAKQLL